MLAENLRQAVLQSAVMGRLVEQNFSDISVYETLINLKKEVELPVIDVNELPYDIPESWSWIRLGEYNVVERGGSPRPIKSFITDDPDGVNWIKIGDTDIGGKYISSTKEKIIKEGISKSRFVNEGDFLLTNSMSFGRPYILKTSGCIHDGWLVIRINKHLLIDDYLYYVLSSQMIRRQFQGLVAGSVVKNLNTDSVRLVYLPIPPLEEQKRIVAKIEEVMKEIDQYEVFEKELHALKQAFPGDLKKSLLQAAIQGKLVEQHDSDGNVDELIDVINTERERLIKEKIMKKPKALESITEEDIPFDIPDNWRWVRLGDITTFINYGYTASALQEDTGVKLLRITDIQNNNVLWDTVPFCNITKEKFKNYQLKENDIVIARTGGTVGKSFKIRNISHDSVYASYLIRVQLLNNINVDYIKLYLDTPFYWNQISDKAMGTGQPNVNATSLSQLLIPFPPLEEQGRIVEKLEQLLPLCDELI